MVVNTDFKGKPHACEEAREKARSICTVSKPKKLLRAVVHETWVCLDGESGWMETERVKQGS